MPVLDGFETLKRIRQDPRLAALPVLAVTAYAMRGDREKILSSGFDGYLSKPITSTELERELNLL
ncbi:MAG: response regulator [Terriglobales bacterium]